MKEVSSSVHDGKENIITPTEAPVGENVQSDISGNNTKKDHKFNRNRKNYSRSSTSIASLHSCSLSLSLPKQTLPLFLSQVLLDLMRSQL